MGNHGSRRDGRRGRGGNNSGSNNNTNNNHAAQGGQAVQALLRVEEVRGHPVDSYDKLIAWLAEMAEHDNVQLDTSVFVKQLTSVCESTAAGSGAGAGAGAAMAGSEPGGGSMALSAGTRRSSALRQNSASCESRASSSGDTHRLSAGRSTYSRSFDDTLDPRHAWRQHVSFSSRQGTCSDDLEEDPDVRNASMESLYSGSDRDSEVEAMASTYTCEPSASRRARFSQQRDQRIRRPLLRQALLGSSACSTGSVGDWGDAPRTVGSFSEGSHRRAAMTRMGRSYSSCSDRGCMITLSSLLMPAQLVPCSASTGDLDKLNTSQGQAGGEQTPMQSLPRRRSVSLLNLTPPGKAAYYVPDAAPPDTPPAKAPPKATFLDDTLLDGNLADILFSVEALWPKK